MDPEALSILVNQIERGTNAARAIQEVMASGEYSPTVWVDGLGYADAAAKKCCSDTRSLAAKKQYSRPCAGC
jgi:hypothetical protein